MGQISREFSDFYPLRIADLEAKIRVSAVSYINSFPFIFGLENSPVSQLIEVELDNPAACAEKLKSGQVDIGLIPVAEIPNVPNSTIISSYCIGSDGPVESVCLYSEVPMNEIEVVLLDPESRTSVKLARILAKEKWRIRPVWKPAKPGFETDIAGTTAGVVIGDRAFKLNQTHLRRWDLSTEWSEMTALPFVFAAWVSNRKLSADFESAFNSALEYGLHHKSEALRTYLPSTAVYDDRLDYVNQRIQYNLDDKKLKALERFLSLSKAVEIK